MNIKRVFVIRNQLGQYLDKHSGWQSGSDNNAIFRADFHDQALNTLLEINSKDISLRGKILEVDIDEKKRPIIDISAAALALDQAAKNNQSHLIDIIQDDNDISAETSDHDDDSDNLTGNTDGDD